MDSTFSFITPDAPPAKLFLSCKGAELDRGISDLTEAQAHLRQVMLTCASKKYLLLDHTKFGHSSLSHICDLSAFDEIITDSGTDPSIVNQIRAMGIKITVANVAKGV